MKFRQFWKKSHFLHFFQFFPKIYQDVFELKNRSRGRIHIPRPVLESSGCQLFISKFFFSKFGYFCNLNGKKTSQLPKRNIETVIPFWLQKGIKICKFVDAIFFFEKYGPSAFQNRSRNLYTTSGCDFMMIWSLVKKA